MKINILQLINGAIKAKGLTVIIDVFRACTVESYIMNNNAKAIIPVADKELAYKLKTNNQKFCLIGERKGKILDGFDYGNSPSQIENIDFSDKIIIHTTSAGTQGFENAKNAEEIITGALVNAKAIVKYILQTNPKEVSLVCMGFESVKPIEEDTICAEYIKALLLNKPYNITMEIEKLKQTSGAKFFDKSQNEVFPEKDFYLSTEINKFDFVLKLVKNKDGINELIKINV